MPKAGGKWNTYEIDGARPASSSRSNRQKTVDAGYDPRSRTLFPPLQDNVLFGEVIHIKLRKA